MFAPRVERGAFLVAPVMPLIDANDTGAASRNMIWTIPASRAKNGVTHVVPLSTPVQEILRDFPRFGDLVFPGIRGAFGGWSDAKAALDVRSGVTGWVLHDLRRTMATGLQRLGARLEVTEAILNDRSSESSAQTMPPASLRLWPVNMSTRTIELNGPAPAVPRQIAASSSSDRT
jgi:integrase